MPNLEKFSIMNIIGDEEMFRLYCESLLSCVVGKTWWNNHADKKKVSEMASISDEAFALLLLENSYNMWKGMGEDPTYKIVRDRETTVDMSRRVVPVVGTMDDTNNSTATPEAGGAGGGEGGTSQEPRESGQRQETPAATGEVVRETGRQLQRRRRGKNVQGESTNGYANTNWTFNGPDTKKYHGWDMKGMNRYKKLYSDVTAMRNQSKQRHDREVAYMEVRERIASKRKKAKVTMPRELGSYKQPNGFEDMIRMQGGNGIPEHHGALLDENEFVLSDDECNEEEEALGGSSDKDDDEAG
jgi:hypothetical protein